MKFKAFIIAYNINIYEEENVYKKNIINTNI